MLIIINIIYIYNSKSISILFSYDSFNENYKMLSIVCIIYLFIIHCLKYNVLFILIF